jgi:hypothetical protein
MRLKRIAASAASLVVICGMFTVNRYKYSEENRMFTAYADEYEFDYVDEYDYDDIDEIEIDDVDIDEIVVETEISENESNSKKRKHNVVKSFFISLLIGLISALIVLSIMKSSMKSVHKKAGASDYRKENSFKLEHSTDTFLYKKVEKIAISKTNTPNR